MLDADFEWGAKEVLASVRDAIDSSDVRELSQHSAFGGTGSGSGETSVLAGLASSFLSIVGAVAATTPTGSSAAHDGSGASSSTTSVTTPSLDKCSQALQFPLCAAANNAHDRSALPTSLEGVNNVAACAFNFDKDPRYLPDPDVIACFDAYPDQLLTTWRADAKVLYVNALALQSPTVSGNMRVNGREGVGVLSVCSSLCYCSRSCFLLPSSIEPTVSHPPFRHALFVLIPRFHRG